MPQVRDVPLTADEVALELHHSRAVILRWARSGELPMFKVGRTWLINADTFEAWKRAREVGLHVVRAS